jgi:hypothetical protein
MTTNSRFGNVSADAAVDGIKWVTFVVLTPDSDCGASWNSPKKQQSPIHIGHGQEAAADRTNARRIPEPIHEPLVSPNGDRPKGSMENSIIHHWDVEADATANWKTPPADDKTARLQVNSAYWDVMHQS